MDDGQRPEMRRTMTLSEQLSTPDPAIRDFLKIPQDYAPQEGGGSPTARDADGDGGGMARWKPLRDRLQLRRAANAWQKAPPAPKVVAAPVNMTSSGGANRSNKYNYSPGEAAAAFSRSFSRTPSLRTTTPTFSRVSSTRVGPTSSHSSSSRRHAAAYDYRNDEHDHDHDDGKEEEEDEDDEEEEDQGGKEEAPVAQMSLMALLEQSDSWDEDEEGGGARKEAADDDEDDGEGREEEMVHVCCVCMVRHKGAAFIPCGHTFCRLCSRELWVSRGNCPLCNGFIQEILDIF
jgi:hypothetical protein